MEVTFVPTERHHIKYIPKDALPRECADSRGITALNPKTGPLGICLFDTWTANSCQIHIWIDNPVIIKYGFLTEIFDFVFSEESGRKLVVGFTPSDNPKALKFIKHVGLEEITRIPNVYGDGIDAVLTTLTKQDCRWITPETPRLSLVGG
jgi:hypothetical protein